MSLDRAFRSVLAAEEKALEERKDLLAREGLHVGRAAVVLQHPYVVFESLVGMLEGILELEPLEDDVVGAALVEGAQVGVDRTAHCPHGARPALDPEDDPLLVARFVDAVEHPLGDAPRSISPLHRVEDTIVLVALKDIFSFLFQRSPAEERVAQYVVREHDRGRALKDILEDKYVVNRLSPDQRKRLLDRPEILRAVGADRAEAAKAAISS